MTSREGTQTSFCPVRQRSIFIPTVVDGVLLPKSPEEMLAEKKFNTVPYLLGVNKQEFGWVIPKVRTCEPLGRAPRLSHHLPPLTSDSSSSPDPIWGQDSCPLCTSFNFHSLSETDINVHLIYWFFLAHQQLCPVDFQPALAWLVGCWSVWFFLFNISDSQMLSHCFNS